MKICYLSDASSTHTKKWCKYFTEKGYDISVISLNNGKIEGVDVYPLDFEIENIQKSKTFSKIKYLKANNKVKNIIRNIKPDIVHAHYASSYGLFGSLVNYHPYVLSVWGSDVYDFPKENFLYKKIIEYNLGKADYILSTSKTMAEETNQYTNKKIEITPFGVDLDLFKPDKTLKNDNNTLIIGTVKTLEKKYGIEYLIKAFSILKEKYSYIKLMIGGNGSQKNYLEELCENLNISSDVEFLGYLSQDEVIKTFNSLDIAVFPSTLDSESFGVAAVEAQACEIPVVVTNAGGLPEATNPGVSSIVINKKSVKELTNALEKLIIDNDLRNNMGIEGRKYVIEKYNILDNFNKVDLLYKKIVSKDI